MTEEDGFKQADEHSRRHGITMQEKSPITGKDGVHTIYYME